MGFELLKFVTQDESWLVASRLVQTISGNPHPIWRCTKLGWAGGEPIEFTRALGLSKIPAKIIINAAKSITGVEVKTLEAAIAQLGPRLTTVVLAITIAIGWCRRQKDPALNAQIQKEVLTCAEVGYRMGTKVPALGSHGGALVGLSMILGEAVLAGYFEIPLRKWWHIMPRDRKKKIVASVGCEAYQIGALTLQSFGFGVDVASGVLIAHISKGLDISALTPITKAWEGAFLWCEALRYGRNYPSTKEAQASLRELLPPEPGSGARNLTLEGLHAELSTIRKNGSSWSW